MSNLIDTLKSSRAVAQDYHDTYQRHAINLTSTSRRNSVNASLQRALDDEYDTWEIQPELSPQELRILFKIINKRLPDCGRKRGAILRYIKAYMPEPKPNYGVRILQKLNNL